MSVSISIESSDQVDYLSYEQITGDGDGSYHFRCSDCGLDEDR